LSKHVTAAAAAVVAMVLLPGCAQAGRSPASAPSTRAPGRAGGTTSISSVTASPNKAITWRKVRQVLAGVPVLPGARPVRHPPSAALAKPAQTIGSPNLVMTTRWWTAPGTVPAALRYLRAHPSTDLRLTGHGTFTSPSLVVRSLMLDGPDTTAYRQLTLVMAVTRHGRGVAVRADAEAVWLPRRTDAEHIDAAALTSVDVTITRLGAAPTVHRTLTGHRARVLATIVNHLPVLTPGTYHCPDDLGYVDSLVFHGRGPAVVVRADATGCATVQVTVSGRRQPALEGGSTLGKAAVKALALPAAYAP
jgi:hypothetical protein